MPFDRGTISVRLLKLKQTLPEDALERFMSLCADKLDDVKDEQQIGWVSGRHLLERKIAEETGTAGGHIYLNLRVAQRKIPSTLLKAEIRLEELAWMNANSKEDVPRRIKKEIKASVEEKRLPQMVPSITGIPFVIDSRDGTIYLGTTSRAQCDMFLTLFEKTFGFMPIEIIPEDLMIEAKVNPANYLPLRLTTHEEEVFIGRDFITWIWFFCERKESEIKIKQFGNFAVTVDGPLSFVSDGEGALESSVKKGNPLRSAEASAALKVGKKLNKAKLIIVQDDKIWNTTFDADNFTFSGITLPEGEEMEYHSRFAERVDSLSVLKVVITELFLEFLKAVDASNKEKTTTELVAWIKEKESF